MASQNKAFLKGMRDGVPIGLGYFAVAFSLGITARGAGMTAFQGFLNSLLNHASAGEYAAISAIGAHAGYITLAFMILVANARYLLMSFALSQKLSTGTAMAHRALIGFGITDELFGICVAYPGPLDPLYMYGGMTVAFPAWASGTACGVILGNILPETVVAALSVAIYGMFLAIIIPQARKDRAVLLVVAAGFLFSFLAAALPLLKEISSGVRTIVLTVLIASAAAALCPHVEEEAA